MATASGAELALRDGDPAGALEVLQAEVRASPSDARLRVFLFQLLAVRGEWERAATQLDMAAQLDPLALAMAQTYREAIRCELLRKQVFMGRTSPLILGEPEPWLGLLIESVLRAGAGKSVDATALREQAFDQAPEAGGRIDEKSFGWICDADVRLGPVLEAVINGRYYWVPFARLKRVVFEAPCDLRDVVWTPAHFEFHNGGESVALVPTRYPDSEASDDGAIVLARKTSWMEVSPGVFAGLGQRMLATDTGEHPLMDVREIVMDDSQAGA